MNEVKASDAQATALTSNLDKARRHLARFTPGPVRHLIAGEAVVDRRGATFETLCPVDNAPLARVAAGDAADIDAAARAAAAAFPAWRDMPAARRRKMHLYQ